MTEGYAAFNTKLSLKAKANIKTKDITDDIVTSGDGLYKDVYEDGRYIYRGANPNNYITFNNELWRIIAKEKDGTYKIIRNETLPARAFDEANHRSTAKNSYCKNPSYGCGVYAAVKGEFSSPSGSQKGTVTEDSSIKIYLNNNYYTNNINSTAKGQMTSHLFNIGAVEKLSNGSNDSIAKNIAGEKMCTWTGNVGLVNVSDILKASTNPDCTSVTIAHGTNKCNSNYLLDKGSSSLLFYWTINVLSEGDSSSHIAWGGYSSNLSANVSRYDCNGTLVTKPVVFLKSSVKLIGQGTKENPFQIKTPN